jgi:antitoxin MazE
MVRRFARGGGRNYNVGMKVKSPRKKSPRRPAAAGRPTKALKAKLVRIGNSRGVRIPKAVIEQAGLGDEVELLVRGNEVVLRTAAAVDRRAGWDEAFKKALANLPPDFLHRERQEWADDWQNMPNEFDDKEWTW